MRCEKTIYSFSILFDSGNQVQFVTPLFLGSNAYIYILYNCEKTNPNTPPLSISDPDSPLNYISDFLLTNL